MVKLKKLTDEHREETISELRKKFRTMKGYMEHIDYLTKKLLIDQEEDLYNWREDKTLNVNQPNYDPKKEFN